MTLPADNDAATANWGSPWASSCNEEIIEGYAGAFGVVSGEPYLTDFEKYAGLPVRPVVAG